MAVCRAYRKTLIAGMPSLHHLDDMPVTDKERRLAVAFVHGGLEVCHPPAACMLQYYHLMCIAATVCAANACIAGAS